MTTAQMTAGTQTLQASKTAERIGSRLAAAFRKLFVPSAQAERRSAERALRLARMGYPG